MSNCKNVLLVWLVTAIFLSCRGPRLGFDASKDISEKLWGTPSMFTKLLRNKGIIDSIMDVVIYKAQLSEILVENRSITEFALVNTASSNKGLQIQAKGYWHELYFIVLYVHVKNQMDSTKDAIKINNCYALFLSTSYNVNDQCIGLGPAYVGEIGADPASKANSIFITSKVLKVNKDFSLGNKAEEVSLRFYADVGLRPRRGEDTLVFKKRNFKITKIIQGDESKIPGHGKSLIIHVDRVFNDSMALAFKYDSVLTKAVNNGKN
jgi:hypothetical protein